MEKQIDMDILIFNKSKCVHIFDKILSEIGLELNKCKHCNNHVIYYDTKIGIRNKKIQGKSNLSQKVVNGNTYRLCVCETCLTKEFNEYNTKNKSRVFNQMNELTKYAYDITEEDYKKQRDIYILTTEENLIRKWGEKIGREKWEEYKRKQSYTNSFEYKSKKYGWSKDDFIRYNKKRSVTKENLIERWGKKIGNEKWEKYLEKQRYTKSKEYYLLNNTEEDWNKLCKSKSHTYENYINWYGSEEKALEKIKERHNMWKSVSKSSQKYLSGLDEYIKTLHNNIKTYYDSKNKEYMIITNNRYVYYIDYYIKDWKIAIEYNGDLFHANPKKYKEDDKPIPGSNITAFEIWEKDRIKKETLLKEKNIIIIEVWEGNLPKYDELIKEIYEKRRVC